MLLGNVPLQPAQPEPQPEAATGKLTHIDFNVDDDEEGEEEIRKQFYDKFNQQNGIKQGAGGEYDEEYEYEEEQQQQEEEIQKDEDGGYMVSNKKSKSDKKEEGEEQVNQEVVVPVEQEFLDIIQNA